MPFNKILQTRLVLLGKWTFGVFDNKLAELTSTQNAFLIRMSAYAYNGVPQTLGHGAFADYPWYGTDKFFFIETNTFLRNSLPLLSGLTDGDMGCRFVRPLQLYPNATIGGHGTEGAPRVVAPLRFIITLSTLHTLQWPSSKLEIGN